MNDPRPTLSRSPYQAGPVEVVRNRVLRNTYWLLALSLIPTVLGAAVGMYSGLNQIMAASPGMTAIVFLAGAFGLIFAVEKNKDNSLGVGLLLLFTFFMGLMLSRMLGHVLGLSNGASLIATAFGGTALVFGGMATLASTMKRDVSSLGKWLFVGLMVMIVAAVANIWLQMPALYLALSAMGVVIFSAFILYDLKRIIDGGETNYVTATLSVYLSVYNLFSSLLHLLTALGGGDD